MKSPAVADKAGKVNSSPSVPPPLVIAEPIPKKQKDQRYH